MYFYCRACGHEVELSSYSDGGDTEMVCWLDHDPAVKVGSRITLKEIPDVVWTVRRIYGNSRQWTEQRRTWKVGGLS